MEGAVQHPTVFESLVLMLSANATNPSDIIALFNAYTSKLSGANGPPPVQLLQHVSFFELLVRDLFERSASHRLHAAHRHKYVHLLALAAVRIEKKIFFLKKKKNPQTKQKQNKTKNKNKQKQK